jgi:hypothetical protein
MATLFVDFLDDIRKPGGFLGYDVYENHPENGDRYHHINDSQNNEKDYGFRFDAHRLTLPLKIGLRLVEF